MINFKNLIKIKDYKSVICLNGTLPNLDFFRNIINIPIIAADGAANSLDDIGISPDIIIGDLDSVKKELLKNIKFIEDTNQNTSDFQKVLKYTEDNNLFPSIVLGINGGSLDHILNNINIFINTESIFITDDILGLTSGKDINLNIKIGTKLSIFGINNAVVSTDGLKWNLKNEILSFPGYNSCFNRASQNKINIKVKNGKVLIMIYTSDIIDFGY